MVQALKEKHADKSRSHEQKKYVLIGKKHRQWNRSILKPIHLNTWSGPADLLLVSTLPGANPRWPDLDSVNSMPKRSMNRGSKKRNESNVEWKRLESTDRRNERHVFCWKLNSQGAHHLGRSELALSKHRLLELELVQLGNLSRSSKGFHPPSKYFSSANG